MQNSTKFEDQYMDVLQNIEFALAETYRKYEEMTDYDAEKVITTLMKTYQSGDHEREDPPPLLRTEWQKRAYTFVKDMCDMRLSGDMSFEKDGRPVAFEMKPLEIDEIIACLKRVRKSIKMWNKKLGQRGYFHFMGDFVK